MSKGKLTTLYEGYKYYLGRYRKSNHQRDLQNAVSLWSTYKKHGGKRQPSHTQHEAGMLRSTYRAKQKYKANH